MFWDPLDDEPSDIESFGVDDMYGSDSDAEIIWTRPHTEDEPSSSDDQFILVCLFLETHYFQLFTTELGHQPKQRDRNTLCIPHKAGNSNL